MPAAGLHIPLRPKLSVIYFRAATNYESDLEIVSQRDESLTLWLRCSSSLGGRWMSLGVPLGRQFHFLRSCHLLRGRSGATRPRRVPPGRDPRVHQLLQFLGCVLLLLLHLCLCVIQPCLHGAWVHHLGIVECLVVDTSAQTACTSVATSVRTAGVRRVAAGQSSTPQPTS